ncbi:MAG: site-2 protease family protein [Phycisphaerales bacterium]|nr:site-2 protease family protein [Phycisphaerales bacterium]
MLASLEGIWHFLLLIIGFGLVIFIHELGHFVAAKFVGIKVLRFAIGFGPAAFSYRRGVGLVAGSTDARVRKRVRNHLQGTGLVPTEAGREPSQAVQERALDTLGIAETEYRFNWVPLGGYVMMLGQDDLQPGDAPIDNPRSFSSRPIGARMFVISAGVVMNMVLAAALFIVVYMTGINAAAPRIGAVHPEGVAAQVHARNAEALGVDEIGLQPGDRVLRVNGKPADAYKDLAIAVAMAERDGLIELAVKREGINEPLLFELKPEVDGGTNLLDVGVASASTNQLIPEMWDSPQTVEAILAPMGLDTLRPGMRLGGLDGQAVHLFSDIRPIVDASAGRALTAVWEDDQGRIERDLSPEPQLQRGSVVLAGGARQGLTHLLGLTPLMGITAVNNEKSGLLAGDAFVRIGDLAYPNIAEGIGTIRAAKGRRINITVLRDGELIDLTPRVRRNGTIGFLSAELIDEARISTIPAEFDQTDESTIPAAARLDILPGSRIVAVDGAPVESFADVRRELRAATTPASVSDEGAQVTLLLELLVDSPAGDQRPTEQLAWDLTRADVAQLHDLGWNAPLASGMFQPELTLLKASSPIEAVEMGLVETWEMLVMTYLTLDRLIVERTVKVEHLKGPVGIAELGTKFAGEGFIHLLLFLAMISVNLAVINFLPIPIVDGGQFVFLVIEKLKGSPVSVGIQNAATLVGLVLIGAVVLITFYNDMANLLSGMFG